LSQNVDNQQLSMKDSDLKLHAHEFEHLVVRLLESQYETKPFVCVTVASKDGGYDGVLRLDVLKAQALTHYSLVEAKLRSSRELELAAIGKSIVVAYNASANALYIATNRRFAPQALKQLSLFQWKTNLRIVLLDGGVLSAWVRRERSNLGTFDAELLDFIADAEPRDRRVLEYIDPDDETPIQTHVSTTARLPRYEVESGWDGETLARNELRPTTEPRAEHELPILVGKSRTDAVRRIAGLLAVERGVVQVSGAAGSGKSFFVRHLRRELAGRGMPSTLISMTGVTTRRVYFLRVLAALTGVNVEALAAEEGSEGVEALLSTFSDDARPSERQAVAAILASGEGDPFREKPDLQVDLVTRYFAALARKVSHTQILMYENLEHSTREVLDLLRNTTRRLVAAGVSTVFEARRFGEAGVARDAGALDEQRLSPEEWGVVLSVLHDTADLERYEVPELTDTEAIALIEDHWPGFGAERAMVIVRSVGRTPLFIESALNWLHASDAVQGIATARVVADLERFFEGISPTRISQLFRKQLHLWWDRYEDVFAAASLLNGQLPIDALEALATGESVDGWQVARELVRTRLFELDPSVDAVRVVHNLIGDELERLFQTGPAAGDGRYSPNEYLIPLRRVARTLLPRLEAICGEEQASLKAPLFLGAAGQWPEALGRAEAAIRSEQQRRAWTNVSSLSLFALRASQYVPSEDEHNRRRLHVLLNLLDAEKHRGRLALDVNAGHVAEVEERLWATPLLRQTPEGRAALTAGFLRAADHHFAREEFDLTLTAALEAEALTLAHPGEISDADSARTFHMHGLALKGLDRREESFRVYDEAVKRFPDVPFLRNEQRANLAAFNLMTNPALARGFFLEILDARREEPDARKLHVLVDVAMAEFLMRKYDSARTKADAARELADDRRSFLEAARARNILGCCAWVEERLEDADLLFDAGCFAAERALTKRYLWRIRVNRAGTAWERKRPDIALANATMAEAMITRPRMKAIGAFTAGLNLAQSRWYVALVAIGAIYLQADSEEYRRFLSRVPIASLAVDCPNAAKRKARFRGTTHVHARRIMITG
jgi:hypothetical protein